ncbi:MAG: HEAT repeat domain-containing protein [Gemmatimonadaceae bacterium]
MSALALALLVPALSAQSIAERVAKAPDGAVRMTFATRPGICGHGDDNVTIRRGTRISNDRWSSDDVERDNYCEEGPARVVMSVRGGRVASVRTYVGGNWRQRSDVTDLGVVSARAAADYLIQLAASGDARAARDAIFPATIADSSDVSPELLRIARDERRPRDARKQAVFWVSQAAGDSATKGLSELAESDDVDRDVREHAVFALSQRPRDEGVPALIRIARTNKDPEVRRKAIFWLGQSDDPRALALFEELILGKK